MIINANNNVIFVFLFLWTIIGGFYFDVVRESLIEKEIWNFSRLQLSKFIFIGFLCGPVTAFFVFLIFIIWSAKKIKKEISNMEFTKQIKNCINYIINSPEKISKWIKGENTNESNS